MPTVIDELVTEISLDPAKFAAGRQRLQDELSKTDQAVETFGKSVEGHTAKIADAFSVMKRGAVGILAAFIGDEAAQFIERTATMDANTSRLAASIGQSTRELTLWGYMVRAVGGNAAEAGQTFATLSDTLVSFQLGQALPSSQLAYLASMAGVNLLAANNPVEAYMKLTQAAMRMPNDMQRRSMLQAIPGMTPGMMMLALSGQTEELRRHFEGLVGDMKAAGDQAKDLQQKTVDLGIATDNLARVGFPVLTSMVNGLAAALGFLTNTTGDDVIAATKKGAAGAWSWLTDPNPTSLYNLWDRMTGNTGGATRGDRNNNPGNIKFGSWAQAHGASGQDSGGFAVFPNAGVGQDAMMALLATQYQGLTLAQIQQKWVGNVDQGYLAQMMKATGLKAGDIPNLSDPNVRANVAKGIMRGEGTHGVSSNTSVNINIGSITSNKADPKAVADQIPDAIKRSSMLAGINTGLA